MRFIVLSEVEAMKEKTMKEEMTFSQLSVNLRALDIMKELKESGITAKLFAELLTPLDKVKRELTLFE